MEIRAFTNALKRAQSEEDLKSLAPDGLVEYLKQEKPDLKTLAVIANRVRELGSSEKDAVQELFDQRFALDGLHPEVRGGLIKAATQLGISDHQDLAYRLAPVLVLVATADEAMAVVNSGHLLTREQAESVVNIGEEVDIVAVDLVALLTQARTHSADELEAMGRQMSAPKVRPREETSKGYLEREADYLNRIAEPRLGKKIAAFISKNPSRELFDFLDLADRYKVETLIERHPNLRNLDLFELLARSGEKEWNTILKFTEGMNELGLKKLLRDFKRVQSLPGGDNFRKLFDHLAAALEFYGVSHKPFFDAEGNLLLTLKEYEQLATKRRDYDSLAKSDSRKPPYGWPDEQLGKLSLTSIGIPLVIPMGFDFSKLESLSIASDSPFPADLPDLPALRYLDLKGFDFSKGIPDALSKIMNLKRVTITHCQLSEIPEWIREQKELDSLDLQYNHIEKIPDFIVELEKLMSLNVSYNPVGRNSQVHEPIRRIFHNRPTFRFRR